MSNVKSALLVGVGGQGAILISKIMSNGFMQAGFDVKQSEVHGMAQRGGSVSTQVRWGDKVYGPVFGKGEADIMVALERMEAVRYAEFLKPDGVAVINDYAIKSTTIASGAETYPDGCIEAMEKVFRTIAVPASEIALDLGNARCMNERQRTDVAHRRSGFLRFAAGIRAQLHSPQPDCGRQQHRMVCRFDYRLHRGSRCSVHNLCIAQTVMGRQGYTVRTVPLGRTGHNGTDSGSGFRRG